MAISHWGYSLTGCPGMYVWAHLEKWNAERAMMMLWVTLRLHKVEKDTPSPKISLGFTEERGKLNTRDTDIELLCLGPGWHRGRDSSSRGWTDQGSVQKEGSGRALRVYCTSEKQWAKSAKWAQNVLKKQLTGVTRPESTVDASSNPAKGKPKINSREGGGGPNRQDQHLHMDKLPLLICPHYRERHVRALPHTDAVLAKRKGSWENPQRKSISLKKTELMQTAKTDEQNTFN